MKNIKKVVKIELILISLFFVILLTPLINTGASSESLSTDEWRMFHRDLNHTGVYPGTINMHNFRGIESYNIMT